MILLNRWTRLFHFARPSLSNVHNRVALEAILQQRLAKAIARVNQETLQQFSLPQMIQNKLKVQRKQSSLISQRSVTVSILNPSTLEHREVELRLDQQLTDLRLEPTQFDFGFGSSQNDMKHFSKNRGTYAIDEVQEYSLNDKSLLMFNLPENISQQDIRVMLKENIQHIQIKYCVLGLPAFARVQFENQQTLDKCLEKIANKQVEFGDRIAYIKTQEDHERLRLANRRLVVHLQQNDQIQKTLIEMSRFGRVMHIDWPLEASINPSLEDVREFYKNSRDLIKINRYLPDGRVQSEYYPEVRVWRINEDEREEQNIIDRAQQLKEAYENRARFAKEVSVWAGKEHQLNLRHRGYCVVTFSTSEECQNYYFTHGARAKMSLVGERCEFEYDPLFRKQVLRVIDNEKLIGDKNNKRKQEKKKNEIQKGLNPDINYYRMSEQQVHERISNESYNLLDRVLTKYFYDEALNMTEKQSLFYELEEENKYWEWENDLRLIRKIKDQQPSLTFDQLAEKQFYGRVLPKNQKIQKLKIEESKYRVARQEQLFKQFNLLTDTRDLTSRAKEYNRLRERNNRLADQALGIVRNGSYSQTGQFEDEQQYEEGVEKEDDGENIGKQHFSTYRPQQIFRKRTTDEEANYLRRYGQFVRGLIYEYMGVFQDKLLEETVTGNLQSMNPQSLTFLDGTPFLTEEEIPDILQFRRDFEFAQSDYEDFVYGNEFVKSSGVNLKSIFSDYQSFEASALQELSEVGVVEQMRKVNYTGEELQSKIDILNTEVADFGEQFKEEVIDDETYLAKIRKLQHLMPINRLAHLEQVIQNFEGSVEENQAQVFQAHYQKMIQTGIVADEVCQVFGVEKGLSIEELMNKMGQQFNVTRKDLDMLERMRTYPSESLKQDLRKQRRLARNRVKKGGSYDYAKDPSEIYVKDREGYYKVSRFRQI